jgi:formylglycine-generating enzyme required for sulfatase activity
MKRAPTMAVVLLWGAVALANQDTTFVLTNGATMEFVWIEPGVFTMGSSPEETVNLNEQPQHEVTIGQGSWLGKDDVTQGEWEAVRGPAPWSGQTFVQATPNRPAVDISWQDVQTFVARLNQPREPGEYRLPTEAEWEYACRAHTTTRWSFGEDESRLLDHAWYYDDAWAVGETYAHAVGTKLANPWGLYDMHGNVWEWCQDWYGDYSAAAQTDPPGRAGGSERVLRGGDFDTDAQGTRSAARFYYTPDYRYDNIGARLVRTGASPTAVEPQTWGDLKGYVR